MKIFNKLIITVLFLAAIIALAPIASATDGDIVSASQAARISGFAEADPFVAYRFEFGPSGDRLETSSIPVPVRRRPSGDAVTYGWCTVQVSSATSAEYPYTGTTFPGGTSTTFYALASPRINSGSEVSAVSLIRDVTYSGTTATAQINWVSEAEAITKYGTYTFPVRGRWLKFFMQRTSTDENIDPSTRALDIYFSEQ